MRVGPSAMTAASKPAALTDRVARVERIYVLHRDRVFRWALRYGAGDVRWAEDVAHDVFVKLLRAIDRLDDDEELARWLYRVTTNRCLTKLKRDRVRASLFALVAGFGIFEPQHVALDAATAAKDELQKTLEVVRSLPPKERIAFSMLHLDGKSQNEIAEIMGLSKGYVSKLLARATERVRAAGYEVDA